MAAGFQRCAVPHPQIAATDQDVTVGACAAGFEVDAVAGRNIASFEAYGKNLSNCAFTMGGLAWRIG